MLLFDPCDVSRPHHRHRSCCCSLRCVTTLSAMLLYFPALYHVLVAGIVARLLLSASLSTATVLGLTAPLPRSHREYSLGSIVLALQSMRLTHQNSLSILKWQERPRWLPLPHDHSTSTGARYLCHLLTLLPKQRHKSHQELPYSFSLTPEPALNQPQANANPRHRLPRPLPPHRPHPPDPRLDLPLGSLSPPKPPPSPPHTTDTPIKLHRTTSSPITNLSLTRHQRRYRKVLLRAHIELSRPGDRLSQTHFSDYTVAPIRLPWGCAGAAILLSRRALGAVIVVAMLVVVGIVFGMVYGLSGRRLGQGGRGFFEDAGDGEVEVEGRGARDEGEG